MLYSGEIDEFVEKELLPDAAETMNALSEAEKTAVSLLLKAYIGFLSEEATVDEQSFPMVKELLSYTQGTTIGEFFNEAPEEQIVFEKNDYFIKKIRN